jgi:hypothetical protein
METVRSKATTFPALWWLREIVPALISGQTPQRNFAADYIMAALLQVSAAGCTALLARYFRRYN